MRSPLLAIGHPSVERLPYLEPGTPIYVEDLEAWERKAGVRISSGDAIFVRTDRWARRQALGPWNIAQNAAGVQASVAPWIKARGVAFAGSDAALDLLDNQHLEAVAATAAKLNRWEFMVTIAPVPVTGGTGFPVNTLSTF